MKENTKIDKVCDIFSAGVVLHVLLTNRYLFERSNRQEIYKNNKNMKFDLEEEKYSQFDAEAMDLLRRMLVKEPENRITACEILSHPFMSGLVIGKQEKEEVSPASTSDGMDIFFH